MKKLFFLYNFRILLFTCFFYSCEPITYLYFCQLDPVNQRSEILDTIKIQNKKLGNLFIYTNCFGFSTDSLTQIYVIAKLENLLKLKWNVQNFFLVDSSGLKTNIFHIEVNGKTITRSNNNDDHVLYFDNDKKHRISIEFSAEETNYFNYPIKIYLGNLSDVNSIDSIDIGNLIICN